VDGRNTGELNSGDYDRLEAEVGNIRLMKEEAASDGVLSAGERATLKEALRSLEAEVAKARTGLRTATRPRPGHGRIVKASASF
jgi:hypothetical protein